MSKMGRIGEIEELILRNLYRIEHEDRGRGAYRVGEKYHRITGAKWGQVTEVALLEVWNWIYGVKIFDASKRASFSRAVRTLEDKGLIETRNRISGKKGYRTHAKLTEKGEELVEKVIEPRVLKDQEADGKEAPNVNNWACFLNVNV